MLHDLTTDAREGYGVVVLSLRLCTLFVNCTDTGNLPLRNELL